MIIIFTPAIGCFLGALLGFSTLPKVIEHSKLHLILLSLITVISSVLLSAFHLYGGDAGLYTPAVMSFIIIHTVGRFIAKKCA